MALPKSPEGQLALLLRLSGPVLLLAIPAMFLPTAWMAATHQWLGLGEFPASTLVDYLTRSIAALYAMHGMLYLVLATDIRRFRPVLALVVWMNVGFGGALVLIGFHAGLPWYWKMIEGPPLIAFGLLLAWLLSKVPAD